MDLLIDVKMETKLSRLEAIIPTLATREDLTRLEARLEALMPTLATREDLACLESRMMGSIGRTEAALQSEIGRVEAALHIEVGRVQTTLHTEMNKLTWRLMSLLSGLLPAMLAATVYVFKYL